jgi:hypothetical protein
MPFPGRQKRTKIRAISAKVPARSTTTSHGKSCLLATRGASTDLLPRDGRDPKPLAARTACPTNICRFHAIVPAVGAAVQGRPFPFHRHCRESGIGNVADGTAIAFNYVEIATRGTNQQSLFLTAPGCWPSRPYRRLPLPAPSSSRAGAKTAERETAF